MTDDWERPFTPLNTENQVNESSSVTSLTDKITQIGLSLRPGQQQMANWTGGPLAVSAVPGAGKSTGMARAAAIAIARYQLHPRRQLIVVTFTRSAASNIRFKIIKELKDLNLPLGGFEVHTLHGLALSIATHHRELSGLDLENSTLILPTPSNRITRTCVERWISENSRLYQRLIEGCQFDGEETERLRRQSVLRTEVLPDLAWKVIQEAKSSGLKPEDLEHLGKEIPDEYETLKIAAGLYEHYQQLLQEQNLIDYDEMILAALRVLEYPQVRQFWQNQVFAVFEDEAQDSTPLQAQLLETLAADFSDEILDTSTPIYQRKYDLESLNLIRVGDPNQAINSTFTPADPIYFRHFCHESQQLNKLATMNQSGRSSQIIIDAANYVLEWVNQSKLAGKEQPFELQKIQIVGENDPQTDANPEPTGLGLELHQPGDINQTVELIMNRVIDLYEKNKESNFAILVRENRQGEFVSNCIKDYQNNRIKQNHNYQPIKVYDASQSARNSQIPAEILSLLQFIDRPHSPDYLKAALKVFSDRHLISKQDFNAIAIHPEQFLYPSPLNRKQSSTLHKTRSLCRSLLTAKLELPPYQLISFLALTLKYEKSELATAEKLTERIIKQTAGNQIMSAILNTLNEIVSSERFEPVEIEPDNLTEGPLTRPGQLTIITMHKAKGLDWDYVFLPFLHAQTIPGELRVLSQRRFLGEFTLSEVARAEIRAYLHEKILPTIPTAWEQAKDLKIAEEYRLLYVAMTRAKRLLWMSAARLAPFNWNKPENLQERPPCPVMPALKRKFPDHSCQY
ncbi:MAG: ATP-dependent helicase [Microcoleaceae cyanobacterium]